MAYDDVLKSMKKIEQSKKSENQKLLERYGYELDNNGNILIDLPAQDGTKFGKVTYDAYKAIESGTLDSYKPNSDKLSPTQIAEEQKALDKFKKYTGYGRTIDDVITKYNQDKFGKGNIDLANRPTYTNPDGKISTVDSITVGIDDKQVVLPTIVTDENGKAKRLTTDEAVEYYKKTGQYLGKFDTQEEADEYAQSLHIDQALYYSPIPLAIELDGQVKNFGEISTDAYIALINNKLGSYTTKSEDEKKAITEYTKFIEDYAKKQREPEDFWQGLLHGAGYTLEKLGAGATDFVSDMGNYIWATGATLLRPVTWGSWNKGLKDFASNRLNSYTLGDLWSESAESRYRVPDWYRQVGGQTAEGVGALAVPMAVEYLTKGLAPTEGYTSAQLAKMSSRLSTAKNTTSYLSKFATKLAKPTTSEIIFGLGATSSATSEAYKQTGDLGKSYSYGILNGLGEMATERLFGGFGGTGIGPDELIDVHKYISKIPKIGKLASTKYGKKVLDIVFEGVEEEMMALADPLMQKATIKSDANLSEVFDMYKNTDYAGTFFQGMLLSSVMNAGTYTFNKTINTTNKIKTIKDLNKSVNEINSTLPSDVNKYEPLKLTATVDEINRRYSEIQRVKGINVVNGTINGINAILENDADKIEPLKYDSTIDEIKQKQNEIQVFGTLYADLMVEELAKNNPEKFKDIEVTSELDEIASTEMPTVSVGDTFRDTRTGGILIVTERDAENTTIKYGTSEQAVTKVFPNSQADKIAINDNYTKVDASADTTTPATENTTEIPTKTVTPQAEMQSVKVGDVYENKEHGTTYTIVSRDDKNTTYTVKYSSGHTSTTTSDNLTADTMFYDNSLQKVKEGNTATPTEPNSNSTTTEIDATDVEVEVVVDAINETLVPGGKELLLDALAKDGRRADITTLAKSLRKAYKNSGTLGKMAEFFTDNGAKVISSIESTLDKTDSTATNVTSKDTNDTSAKTTKKSSNNEELDDLYKQLDDIESFIEDMKELGFEQDEIDKTVELADETKAKIARLEQENQTNESKVESKTESKSKDKKAVAKNATTTTETDTTESLFIDDRTFDDVSSRKVKAFQYENPSVKPFYKAIAQELLDDLKNTIKGERFIVGTYDTGQEWTGTTRHTSEAIARIKDYTGATYDKITDAVQRIINDEGQENIALAKKIELVIDDMLSYGYTNFDGYKIPADEEYLALKEELSGKEYQNETYEDDDSLSVFFDDNERFSLSSMGESFFGNEKITADEFQSMLEDGDIIPLSKRFNRRNYDVRFSLRDNDYLKAVESGDVETASRMIEEAAEKAFSNSKVRDENGNLKLVYHGTVNDFTVFNRQFANIEGDFGKGYYFTSNEYDVDANYADEDGPDLKNKISRLADKLEWEDEYSELSYDEREEIARQRLVTSEPKVITAYLNMENPVYITPDENGTFLNYDYEYDEETDEYGEPEGLLVDFIEALQNNASDYAYRDVDFSFLYEYAYDNGGVYASDAVKSIKGYIMDGLTDESGDLAVNEVIRLAFEEIGFDGIIDSSVYYKFRNMSGMDSGTTHYIVFDSNQIKSADIATYDDNGNVIPLSERFNLKKEDMRYSTADYAPTFYSHMGKTIDEMKQDKIGANSVVSYLKGRGVKDEEIKWSGIETFLEGKKSVTKAELQEFVAGSMLQIEEVTLDDNDIPYTDEQTTQIQEYENERNEIFEELKSEWKKAIGTDFPMQHFGLGLESSVTTLLIETNREMKESTDAGNEMVEARKQLREFLEKDDLGYDSVDEAYYYATRDPQDFLDNYDLTDDEKAIFERFISAKENYKKPEGIPIETQIRIKGIASKADEISRKISRIKAEHNTENKKHKPKWSDYKLDGGENYREIVFKMPESTYTNQAMSVHWGGSVADGYGVLAHARVQDFEVDGKKMLFIEEIQSDWHNDGAKKGYIQKGDAEVRAKRQELENYIKSRLGKENSAEEIEKLQEARREYLRLGQNMGNADAVPDAPYRNNYHEFVLKNLIRMAAEQGYDSIGWTTADIQSDRWSDEYAEGYRIEYDQDIPKFLNKYGKKWGAKVGQTEIGFWNEYTRFYKENEVWTMPITDSMKESVLYEGQALYSLEKGGNNNEQQNRSDSISGNSRWGNNGNTREQTERISSFEQRNQGKDATERQRFAKELLEQGKTEETIEKTNYQTYKYDLVKPEDYNDEMKSMVEEAAKKGEELGFFVGSAKVNYDSKGEFVVDGIKFSDTRMLVQYDAKRPPQKIYKHEHCHDKWNTPEMQNAKETILNKLSPDEKKKILSQERYKRYAKIYKGRKDIVWEEFVCDVMSDLNDYTATYIDIVYDYWYGNESVEGYTPSTYAESIDAGGEYSTVTNEQDSDGNTLTKEQQEYFKDSKVRDENGNLKVMYHGTNSPNFTVFDSSFSDDKLSLFFTDSPNVADSYTTVQNNGMDIDPYRLPNTIKTMEDFNEYMEDKGLMYRIIQVTDDVIEKARNDIEKKIAGKKNLEYYRKIIPELENIKGKYINYNGDVNYIIRNDMIYDTGEDAVKSIVDDKYWVTHKFGNRYKVYLNLKNPYILDSGKTYKGVGQLEISNDIEGNVVAYFTINDEDFEISKGYSESQEDFVKRFLAPTEVKKYLDKLNEEREIFIQEEMEFENTTREEVISMWTKYGDGGIPVKPFDYKVENASIEYTESGHWNHLEFDGKTGNTRELSKWAKENEYDGVIIKNLKDIGGYSGGTVSNPATVVIAFDSNQIKSTSNKNPTLDDDIRYSLEGDDIPDFLKLWDEYVDKYGAIPKGEKPARDIDVPRKISKKDVVSQTARTLLEAGITPDEMVSEFEKAIVNGDMTHEVIHNKKAHGKAIANIKKLGFEGALKHWNDLMDTNGLINEVDFAMGMELYNQCVTNKDVRNAMKIASDLCVEATRSARNLQLVRLLKKMTPDGQLYYLEKSVQKMNEEFQDKLGDKFKDIELDEGLMEEFFNETDETKRDEIYDKICQHIADQMPVTLKDKWDSWRYLAMLGNPRTHIRNLTGNLAFVPAIRMKNFIAAIIEHELVKNGKMDASERSKSIKKSEEAKIFAEEDSNLKEVEKMLQGVYGKYATTSDIEGKITIFKTKLLEIARTTNFDLLEAVDMKFLKFHYKDALARLITVRNLDVNSIDAKTLDKIRQIAIKEAQKATFRDANSMAESLSAIIRKMKKSDKVWARYGGYILEGIQPFVKTPMNIAKQGMYYSPAGLVVGVYNTVKMKKGADINIADVVDDFAKGLTGTSMALLGYILTALGILKGGDDEDKKKNAFDELTGEQSYSINFGDWSYTIDWMMPSSMSLFVGSEWYKLTQDDTSVADFLNAMAKLTDPLLELSVFSGWQKALKASSYSDTSPVIAIMTDALASYVAQGLPTIGGQISRLFDKNKREYYYMDKTSDMPILFQRLIGQASSKIPFVSYLYTPSVDEWGRDEEYGDIKERFFENTMSPGYFSKERYTEVDTEIKRLYDATGNNEVLPSIQSKYFKIDGVTKYLSAEEYAEVKKLRGQKAFELISDLMSNKKRMKVQNKETGKYRNLTYSQMTDAEKVSKIKDCYSDAGDYAKEQFLEQKKKKSK